MAGASRMPTEEGVTKLQPWRHMVLTANFSIRFIVFGLMKSYGLLIPYLAVELASSYAIVGLIVTLQVAVTLLACPFANMVLQRFPSRTVSNIGSCVCGIAFVGVAFARDAWSMGFCVFLAGLCFSLPFQYMVVMLRDHYREFFGFANSVSHSGSALGSLFLPYLTSFLYEAYGIRATLLCLGGITLNIVPLGLVLKPPQEMGTTIKAATSTCDTPPNAAETPSCSHAPSEASSGDILADSPPSAIKSNKKLDRTLSDGAMSMLGVSDSASTSSCDSDGEVDCDVSSSGDHTQIGDSFGSAQSNTRRSGDVVKDTLGEEFVLLLRDDKTDEEIIDKQSESLPTQSSWSRESHGSNRSGFFVNIWRDLVRFFLATIGYESLRDELAFCLVFFPCRFFLDVAYLGWLIFMASYALSVGVAETKTVYLPIAASSIGGILSRFTLGMLLNCKPHLSSATFAFCILLSAVALVSYTIDASLSNLIVWSFISGYGLFGATSLYYAMLADHVASRNFAGVLAGACCCSGLGVCISGSLSGLMYDVTHSFPFTFQILGGVLAVTGVTTVTCLCHRRKDFNSTV